MTTIKIYTSNEESEGTEKSGKLPGENEISEELPATRHNDALKEWLITTIKINH